LENKVAKTSQKKNEKKDLEEKQPAKAESGWISMRSGLTLISLISILLAIFTSLRAIPIKGVVEGILWGIIFGGSIWVIFFGALYLNRLMRRG
jgi:hypothetical protein